MKISDFVLTADTKESGLADMNRELFLQLQKVMKENEELKGENKILKKNIRIDPLTQLYNRQFMDEYLKEEINRSERYCQSFSMLIVDIDHFKKVNDTFGHQAGDAVLRKVANMLKQHLRNCDLVFRYGGEEFLIALPSTNLSGAYITANKIRKVFEGEFFDAIQSNITVSIGVSERKSHESLDQLIYNVDMALYTAKKNGRNQVRIAA